MRGMDYLLRDEFETRGLIGYSIAFFLSRLLLFFFCTTIASGVAPQAVLVVLEATGAYWINLAVFLHHAGFSVSVINPMQAHHFAKALLKRAKTDAIDAQTLTVLAAQLQPAPWTPPPAIYAELQQRLAQRDDLVNIRQQVRNQRHALV